MLYLFLGGLFALATHAYNVTVSTVIGNSITTNATYTKGPNSLYNGGPNCHVRYDSSAGYSLYHNSPCDLGCAPCGQLQTLATCETHWVYTSPFNENLLASTLSQMPSNLANNIGVVAYSPEIPKNIICPDGGTICISWVQQMASFYIDLDSIGDGCDIYGGAHQIWIPFRDGSFQHKTTIPNTGSSGPPPVKPPTGPTCYSGFYGSGNGQGSAGDCCQSDNDCRDVCNSGRCDGSNATPGPSCAGGSSGSGNGDGSSGACCVSSNDCIDTCTNNVCGNGDGSSNGSSSCSGGNPGAGNGNGASGACCTTSNDCLDTCNNGMCGTGGIITTTTTKTTTAKASATNSCSCTSGYSGKANGGGPTGACCTTSNDCVDTCNSNGICGVSGVIPTCSIATTSTASKTTTAITVVSSSTLNSTSTLATPTPTSIAGCLSLTSLGKQLQDGLSGTCCINDLDCNLDNVCIDGTCTTFYDDFESDSDCDECQLCSSSTISTTISATSTTSINSATNIPNPYNNGDSVVINPFPIGPPFCYLCFAGTGGGQGPVGVGCLDDSDCSWRCNNNVCIVATNTTNGGTVTSTTNTGTVTRTTNTGTVTSTTNTGTVTRTTNTGTVTSTTNGGTVTGTTNTGTVTSTTNGGTVTRTTNTGTVTSTTSSCPTLPTHQGLGPACITN
jgi:hypothetical protein